MNFMSGRPGFCEERTSPSSSFSSSCIQQHKGVPLNAYHHHQLEAYADGGGLGDDDDSDDRMLVVGEGSSTGVVMEREHMFDKVVTPSDVGKLNRLVIPKQHAEKYFPLDSSTNEKGLVLNFEDRNGKPWRFRYSYWNSSQSYVMTKGWTRFVKEKKLDAGDIVSFQRGVGELGKDRLFIDWRRRPPPIPFPHQFSWNPLFFHHPPSTSRDYSQSNAISTHTQSHHHTTAYGSYAYNSVVNGNNYPSPPGPIMYLRSAGPGGGIFAPQQVGLVHAQRGSGVGVEQMVYDSVPVVQGKVVAKQLRLFGVTMDCPVSHESDEYDILSSTTLPHSTLPIIQHQLPPPRPFDYPPNSNLIPDLQLRPYNAE